MSLFAVFLIGISLSMDAVAVSVAKGMCAQGKRFKCACILAFWFGLFQALMPLIGWLSGSLFESFITSIDHWIAFLLLGIIGANMIREAIKGEDEDDDACNLALPHVLMLAVATSIDALAVGISEYFIQHPDHRLNDLRIVLCGRLSRQQARRRIKTLCRHPGRCHSHRDRNQDPDRTPVLLTAA